MKVEVEHKEKIDAGPQEIQGQQDTENSATRKKEVMTTENVIGVQTRAMTEAQSMEDGAQRDMGTNQEGVQGTNPTPGQAALDPAMNPTLDLHRMNDIVIEEFVRRQGAIGLDWYVPDFSNMRVGVLIKNRLQINTTRGRILFNYPPLKEFFPTSTFELHLATGHIPHPTGRHRHSLSTGGIRHKTPSRKTAKRPGNQ